jgi:hypothetical protein
MGGVDFRSMLMVEKSIKKLPKLPKLPNKIESVRNR